MADVSLAPVSVPIPPPAAWLSVADIAAELNIGRRSVYAAIRSGKLRAIAANQRGDFRVNRQWLMAWWETARPADVRTPQTKVAAKGNGKAARR